MEGILRPRRSSAALPLGCSGYPPAYGKQSLRNGIAKGGHSSWD